MNDQTTKTDPITQRKAPVANAIPTQLQVTLEDAPGFSLSFPNGVAFKRLKQVILLFGEWADAAAEEQAKTNQPPATPLPNGGHHPREAKN